MKKIPLFYPMLLIIGLSNCSSLPPKRTTPYVVCVHGERESKCKGAMEFTLQDSALSDSLHPYVCMPLEDHADYVNRCEIYKHKIEKLNE